MTQPSYDPLCVRVSRYLFKLIQLGWRPRLDTQFFVEWDRREHNSLADHAANVALDCCEDWTQSVGKELLCQTLQKTGVRIRVCSDGAKRGNGRVAAGMALVAYDDGGQQTVLLRAGRLLGKLPSAFQAEMIALELCLNILIDYFV